MKNLVIGALCLAINIPFIHADGTTVAGIDDPEKEWCYLAKSTTVVGVPFMPDCVQITWDGAVYTRKAELCFFYGKDNTPVMQRQKNWLNGWIPIIQYDWNDGLIHYQSEIFNTPLDGEDESNTLTFVTVRMTNTGTERVDACFVTAIRGSGEDYRTGKPNFPMNAEYVFKNKAFFQNGKLLYSFSSGATLECVPGEPYTKPFKGGEYHIVPRAETGIANFTIPLNPGESRTLEFKMPRVPTEDPTYIQDALKADATVHRNKTVDYWQALIGDVCVIEVPEKRIRNAMKANSMHALLGTRTRRGERFQTDGLPYANCFISALFDYERAYDCLGLSAFVETNVPQLAKRIQPDGLLLDTSLTHGKIIFSSHGQAMMMIVNHIAFTQDQAFAEEVYPMIQKAVACIATDHNENEYGLMRPSWPYDNEMISGHYTSHNFWCLAALRRSIYVARLLGKTADEKNWLALHESYEKAILKAVDESVHEDGYVPTGLYEFITGEKARKGFVEYRTDQDWDNCLLAWPTELLNPDDPRIIGTNNRLRDTKYREGIMTYRNGQHLHQYNTVNPATQDLVAGRSEEALKDIYHILLHSGSTFEGYENQVSPWTDRLVHGAQPPHAWGSSKIAGLIRNMFVLEHGGKLGLEPENRNLYLFSVVSPAWVKVGETIAVRNAPTEFGTLTASMMFTETGAKVLINKQFHTQPGQIIVRIPFFVKNVQFTSDATTATQKGNAIYLSNDATSLDFIWTIDDSVNTAYQDILMHYRQEPGWWQGHRDDMPEKPKGFLTDAEKSQPAEPLSFKLVTEAFLQEYNRRTEPVTLSAPKMLTALQRTDRYFKYFDSPSLTTGKPVTSSYPKRADRVNDGKKGDTKKYWEADGSKGFAWWQVDFQKVEDISRIVVVPYYGDDRSYQYTVETSLNGKDWVMIIDQSRNTTPVSKNGYSFEFQPTKVRYLRVNMLKNSLNFGLHLVEVMAF